MATPKTQNQPWIDSSDPKEILKAPYSRIITPQDDGTFMAEILEFYGCIAQGDTPEEALSFLEKMAPDWIAISLERGTPIPQPMERSRYGGKLALRMPRSLHRHAAQIAARDGASLNQFIVTSIAKSLGADEVMEKLGQISRLLLESKPNVTINLSGRQKDLFANELSTPPTPITHTIAIQP